MLWKRSCPAVSLRIVNDNYLKRPDLEFQFLISNGYGFELEIYTNGTDKVLTEGIFCKSRQNATLSNAWLSSQHNFEQKVASEN